MDLYGVIKETFRYENGNLYYIVSKKSINKGSIAGSINPTTQQSYTMVGGKMYLTAKLIYLLHYKILPEYINFLDGDSLNLKIENIKSSIKPESKKGRKASSGFKGICFHKPTKKWIARINNKHIGLFQTIEEAHSAQINYLNGAK
jgi:hypothetical protein